jgi:hydroxypyruvate reductase
MTWLPVFSQHEALKTAPWGGRVARILSAALKAVEPGTAVATHMQRRGDSLWVAGQEYDLQRYRRVWIVGAGKAGAPMANSVAGILGERLSGGLVVVKEGYAGWSGSLPDSLRLVEAGHPIPDERGMRGAQQIASLLAGLTADDLVICLLSGGGSALLVSPAPGLSLADLQVLTGALLACGASIDEINTLRKHLEQLKGGGLARLASPASLVTLVLSDVVGDPLDVIASGPTVPDPSTFEEAWQIIERYGLAGRLPGALVLRLQRGRRGGLPETPKPGEPLFDKVKNAVVGSNLTAAQAALEQAQAEGFHSLLLTTRLQGEARQAGRFLAAILRQIAADGWPLPRPACLVAGGETTVTLAGDGLGGRNQELALGALIDLAGLEEVALLTLATDGGDGPTDAAGAIVTGRSLTRAQQMGLDPRLYLARNDAYHFFAPLGDLIRTGPTQTNVTDLAFLFAF